MRISTKRDARRGGHISGCRRMHIYTDRYRRGRESPEIKPRNAVFNAHDIFRGDIIKTLAQ